MLRLTLSALLLGMLPPSPSVQLSMEPALTLEEVSIAPPAEDIEVAGRLSASGVVILDLNGGQELYTKSATVTRPMASLTKLMTALVIIEHHDLDEWVKITKATAAVEGNKAYLMPGDYFTVGDLLSALLISSANDAAYALALHHSDSVSAFVEEMNKRAVALGLKNTQYQNPMGLDSASQWSTPKDLALLTAFVMRQPEIVARMEDRYDNIVSRGGTTIDLTHTHALLHTEESVMAGKTGTTDGAKECLVSIVEDGVHSYIVVLLHSLKRYEDMRTILSSLEEGPSDVVASR